ncbi:MAG: serine O-acetyltransferase [Saprospiraceae bacterium]|nr:serine O-acetyltransferase [Saprospiraceae bacterium]
MHEEFVQSLYTKHQECPRCPAPSEVQNFFVDILGLLFPDYCTREFDSAEDLDRYVTDLKEELKVLLTRNAKQSPAPIAEVVEHFFSQLPEVLNRLEDDATAIFDGDPAAKSRPEVIRTYPGFYAMAAYRIAHVLHGESVRIIPRMIAEQAHAKTGIDIHPAATVGERLCIDHGTGVVIGETSVIGNDVKIYQGVTLGALSVKKEDAERKRHPTIGDRVVLYAGATILGGETVISHDSIIGGNVWITKSVAPGSKVYYQANLYHASDDDPNLVIFTKAGK